MDDSRLCLKSDKLLPWTRLRTVGFIFAVSFKPYLFHVRGVSLSLLEPTLIPRVINQSPSYFLSFYKEKHNIIALNSENH